MSSNDELVLAAWTHETIDAECREAYRDYHRELRTRHVEYFDRNPARRGLTHPFAARDRAAALPAGWSRLEKSIRPDGWHRHHLSGGSSQMLALGILGPAATAPPKTLDWLFEPIGPLPALGAPVTWAFEYSVGFALLNESPRTTDIDFMVSGPRGVAAIEAKFTEKGLGKCSCPQRKRGDCSDRVRGRPYWKVAHDAFGLTGPSPPAPCKLDLAYQAVRNVAAVLEMTSLREKAVFALLYDRRNPYFAGSGRWPGWSRMLSRALSGAPARFAFRAISWQELLPLLPRRGRSKVFEWAAEKHGLSL